MLERRGRVESLKEKDLPLASIGLVLNTHSHSDHVACNGQLKELLPGAKFPKLTDGAEFSFGGATVRALATLGHSPDSFCLLEPTTGALFTRDLLRAHPQGTVEALRDRLLAICGSRKDSFWRELSLITTRAVRSRVLKQSSEK